MGFLVIEVALVQIFLQVIQLTPVSIVLPVFHNHLYLHAPLTRKTKGKDRSPSESIDSPEIMEIWIGK